MATFRDKAHQRFKGSRYPRRSQLEVAVAPLLARHDKVAVLQLYQMGAGCLQSQAGFARQFRHRQSLAVRRYRCPLMPEVTEFKARYSR